MILKKNIFDTFNAFYLISQKILQILKFFFYYFRFSIIFGIFGSYLAAGIFNIKNFISGKFNLKYYFLGGLLTTSSSISISLMNDYSDYDSDLINPRKKNRPLILGQVPRGLNLILTAFIILFQFLLVTYSRKLVFYVFLMISLIGTFGYSKLKYIPPFDLLFNALCSIYPFYFGWLLSANKLLPIKTIIMNILFATIIFLHGDIWDMQYDKISTVKIIGKNQATNLIYLILALLFNILPSNINFIKYVLIFFQFSYSIIYRLQSWRIYKIVLVIVSLIVFSGFLFDLKRSR